jgi:hypothetical protein
LNTNFKDPIGEILKDNKLSIEAMLAADKWKLGNKSEALKAYGGGSAPNWIATSDALLKIPEIANSSSITENDTLANKAAIVHALELTKKDTIISKIV